MGDREEGRIFLCVKRGGRNVSVGLGGGGWAVDKKIQQIDLRLHLHHTHLCV